MSRVQPKATPNWCLQVKPDEPWTGRCVKEKIAEDAKRHRCHKKEKHDEPVHACQCSPGVEAVLGGRPPRNPATGHRMTSCVVTAIAAPLS